MFCSCCENKPVNATFVEGPVTLVFRQSQHPPEAERKLRETTAATAILQGSRRKQLRMVLLASSINASCLQRLFKQIHSIWFTNNPSPHLPLLLFHLPGKCHLFLGGLTQWGQQFTFLLGRGFYVPNYTLEKPSRSRALKFNQLRVNREYTSEIWGEVVCILSLFPLPLPQPCPSLGEIKQRWEVLAGCFKNLQVQVLMPEIGP